MVAKKIKDFKRRPERKEASSAVIENLRYWIESHQNVLVVFLVLLVVILLGTWAAYSYMGSKEQRARVEYAQILKEWPPQGSNDESAWNDIAAKLQTYIKHNEGSRQAAFAELDLSKVFVHLKKYDEAERYGEKALQDLPSRDDLKPLVRYQLAAIYSAAGKFDKALGEWQALKQEGMTKNLREVEWQIGKLYAKKGDYPKAVEQYEKALKSPGDYPANPIIEEELSSAKSREKTAS